MLRIQFSLGMGKMFILSLSTVNTHKLCLHLEVVWTTERGAEDPAPMLLHRNIPTCNIYDFLTDKNLPEFGGL